MFKAGQIVYCLLSGWGEVINIVVDNVRVRFTSNGIIQEYDKNGCPVNIDTTLRTLFFGKPNFSEIDTPPFVPTFQYQDIVFFVEHEHDAPRCGWGVVRAETVDAVSFSRLESITKYNEHSYETDTCSLLKCNYTFVKAEDICELVLG